MIRKIEYSKHLPVSCDYMWESVEDGKVYYVLGVEHVGYYGNLHFEILDHSISTMKRMKVEFEEMKNKLRDLGVVLLGGSFPRGEGEETWSKFMKFSGFSEPVEVLSTVMEL